MKNISIVLKTIYVMIDILHINIFFHYAINNNNKNQ